MKACHAVCNLTAILVLFGLSSAYAFEDDYGKIFLKRVVVENNTYTLNLDTDVPYDGYHLRLVGPDDFLFQQTFEKTDRIVISPALANGVTITDGQYKLELRPYFQLPSWQEKKLRELSDAGDYQAMKAIYRSLGIPTKTPTVLDVFTMLEGQFVNPHTKEIRLENPMDNPYNIVASTDSMDDFAELANRNNRFLGVESRPDNLMMAQIYNTDLIVRGSMCTGVDCVSAENFGSDTHRLRENNLRIHFDDTSNSGSFPNNDWRLEGNDSTNGGLNRFSIQDVTAGRNVFTIEAGALAYNLHVEADGDVGIKTANPAVDLHIIEGNTPTVRLEQDGSRGFTAQTWDLGGNEAGFFIRDITHNSKLSFRIEPNSPENSIYIDNTGGRIGFGLQNPVKDLHVRRTTVSGTTSLRLEAGLDNSQTNIWDIQSGQGKLVFKENDTDLLTLTDAGDFAVLTLTGNANDPAGNAGSLY